MSLPARSGRGAGSLFAPPPRLGSTLVEVLVTLAIMGVVMAGVLSALAVVTSAVGDSRAIMEMTDRLRVAQTRLRADLAGITAPATPPLRPEAGQGYLEIIEGPVRDTDYSPEANGNAATLTNLNDRPRDVTKGDADDIIAFTTRSTGDPFVGRFGNTTVESQVAEVVWFASWDPATDISPVDGTTGLSGRPTFLSTTSPNVVPINLFPDVTSKRDWPMLKLYRRVFLVKPELGVIGEQDITVSGTNNLNEVSATTPNIKGLLPAQHDISVRRVVKSSSGASRTIQWVANSLGDLTIPQNRTGHAGNLIPPVTATGTGAVDPAPTPNGGTTVPIAFAMATNRLVPFSYIAPPTTGSSAGVPDPTSRYGEDLVLSNILGFDVKVWDPQAPVFFVNSTDTGTSTAADRTPKMLAQGAVVVPGDPGYERFLERSIAASRVPDARGAYVDLYYSFFPNNNATPNSTNLSIAAIASGRNNFLPDAPAGTNANSGPLPKYSIFAGPGYPVDRVTATNPARLPPVANATTVPTIATYDTWSTHYEMAGARTDSFDGRATNGVDDDGNGIVDDIGERVTTPPFPVPLRGIQIKVRVYEPDSRTVREVTIVEALQTD